MAIFHMSIQIISRSVGRSAVGAAAYRAGEEITNSYDNITHDYTEKGGVVYTEILLPENAPTAYYNRSELWNAVEQSEKRKDSQTAREIEIALPGELPRSEQIKLIREYVQSAFVNAGMCADIAIHDKNDGNPHAHVMLTTRHITEQGFGQKNRTWNDLGNAEVWRARWADSCNASLERLQSTERIDHRSYERQGLDKLPTRHLGSAAHQMEKKGISTDRGNANRHIQRLNEEITGLNQQEEKLIAEGNSLIEDIWVEALLNAKYAYAQALFDYHIAVTTMPSSKIDLEPSRVPEMQKRLQEFSEAHQRILALDTKIEQLQEQKRTSEIPVIGQFIDRISGKHQKIDEQISELEKQRGWYAARIQKLTSGIYGSRGYDAARTQLVQQIERQKGQETSAEAQRQVKESQKYAEIRKTWNIDQLSDRVDEALARFNELCENLAKCPMENQLSIHIAVRRQDATESKIDLSARNSSLSAMNFVRGYGDAKKKALQTTDTVFERNTPDWIRQRINSSKLPQQRQRQSPERSL